MIATKSNQMTFIDSSEFGIITPEMVQYELDRLFFLKPIHWKTIRERFCQIHKIETSGFRTFVHNPDKFTAIHFNDLKSAIDHYYDIQDLEVR